MLLSIAALPSSFTPCYGGQIAASFLRSLLVVSSLIVRDQQVFLLGLPEGFTFNPIFLFVTDPILPDNDHSFPSIQDLPCEPLFAALESVGVHFGFHHRAFECLH